MRDNMNIERAVAIAPVFIAAICSVTSISVVYAQQMATEFSVSAIEPNPQTNYKVCGGLIVGETGANFGCRSFSGTALQQYGYQFRYLDIDLDAQQTKLYGCIIDDNTNMSFCDSLPLPAAGGSSLLSIDLSKPSKMPLPAHFDEEPSDANILEEEDSGDSGNNDDNDEEEENE
jgi:hypothetical protein